VGASPAGAAEASSAGAHIFPAQGCDKCCKCVKSVNPHCLGPVAGLYRTQPRIISSPNPPPGRGAVHGNPYFACTTTPRASDSWGGPMNSPLGLIASAAVLLALVIGPLGYAYLMAGRESRRFAPQGWRDNRLEPQTAVPAPGHGASRASAPGGAPGPQVAPLVRSASGTAARPRAHVSTAHSHRTATKSPRYNRKATRPPRNRGPLICFCRLGSNATRSGGRQPPLRRPPELWCSGRRAR